MADHGQKSEKPTQQRLKKARDEGRFPTSRDFVSAAQFLLSFGIALNAGQSIFRSIQQATATGIQAAFTTEELATSQLGHILMSRLWAGLSPILLNGAIIAALTLFLHMATTGFGLASKQLLPAFSRLNPWSRISQMPQQNLFSAVKALVLMPIIAVVLYAEISTKLPIVANLSVTDLNFALSEARQMIVALLWRLSMALFVLGAIDYARERQRFNSSMRMSKQEIKEEHKEAEGNPQMKMRIRRLQRDAARRSMLKSVPKATAVIVNPTHYAIAVFYEMNSKAIPMVVAKGKDYLALAIREKAMAHNIPIIENKPLAQALYQAVDVNQEIPPHLYRAVAEVLAYIYRTINRR